MPAGSHTVLLCIIMAASCNMTALAADQGTEKSETDSLTVVSDTTSGVDTEVAIPHEGFIKRDDIYYDMNWYRTIRLGSAPLLNPELARSAVIAYKYNLSDLTAMKTETVEFWKNANDLYKLRKLIPATVEDDDTYRTRADFSSENISLEQMLGELKKEGNIVLIGNRGRLGNGGPFAIKGEAVVAWEPTALPAGAIHARVIPGNP